MSLEIIGTQSIDENDDHVAGAGQIECIGFVARRGESACQHLREPPLSPADDG